MTNTYLNRLRSALSLQQPTGAWTNGFIYDPAKRLTSVTSAAGSFGYQLAATAPSRLPIKISLPNAAYITNIYDSVARLSATYLKNSGNTTLDSYAYIYDPANERTNLTRADSSTVKYSYDKIGQLKIADSSVNTEDRGYKYDAAWNVNWVTNDGTPVEFDVNSLNELTNGPIANNYYDSNGNLTNKAYDGGGDGVLFTYDDENRLIAITNVLTGKNTQLVYDGLGRLRVRQEYSGSGESPIGGGVGNCELGST